MLFKGRKYVRKLPSNFKYQDFNVYWSKTSVIKAQQTTSFLRKQYKVSVRRLKFSRNKFDFLRIPI